GRPRAGQLQRGPVRPRAGGSFTRLPDKYSLFTDVRPGRWQWVIIVSHSRQQRHMGLALLILGLAIFVGVHWFTTMRGHRAALIARVGEGPYKGLYSLV